MQHDIVCVSVFQTPTIYSDFGYPGTAAGFRAAGRWYHLVVHLRVLSYPERHQARKNYQFSLIL